MTDPRLRDAQRLLDKSEYATDDIKRQLMDQAFLKLLAWANDADKDIEAHNQGKVRGMANLI